MQFASTQDLQDFLRENSINTSYWGQGSSRTIDELFLELQEGETNLVEYNGQIHREVGIVLAIIPQTEEYEYFLKIIRQTNAQGIERRRNHLPGGKRKLDETPLQAIQRELKEELDWSIDEQELRLLGAIKLSEMSASYPGLRTSYFKSYFLARIGTSFPADTFQMQDTTGGIHRFKWSSFTDKLIPSQILSSL